MAALPLEIIRDIVSRLPATSLIRFKSVSKYWYSLIKSPHFIKFHLNQTLISGSHRHVIACYSSLSSAHLDDGDDNPTRLTFSHLDRPLKNNSEAVGFRFLGSCNGVVLLSDSNYSNVFLFNPCTKSHCKLPSLEIIPTSIRNSISTLYGVGYDNVSDDYKVLKVVQSVCIEVNVFSLRRNLWKRVDDVPSCLLYAQDCCVFVNQGLHYLLYDMELGKYKIIRFDMAEESYSIIYIPEFMDVFPEFKEASFAWLMIRISLGDLGGSLCMLVKDIQFRKLTLWVMKEYGNTKSWTRLFSICTKEIGYISEMRLIANSKDEQRVLLKVNDRQLYWCDLKDESNKVERVQTQGLPKKKKKMSVGVYVESLVLLDEEKVLASEYQVQREGRSMAMEIDK